MPIHNQRPRRRAPLIPTAAAAKIHPGEQYEAITRFTEQLDLARTRPLPLSRSPGKSNNPASGAAAQFLLMKDEEESLN